MTPMLLKTFPPMGIYETLFKFADATQKYMGDAGTHPWAQGFPLTTQLPGGPPLPSSVDITSTDLMYPKADGEPPLRQAIADYYNTFYDAGITADHVAVFAGGGGGGGGGGGAPRDLRDPRVPEAGDDGHARVDGVHAVLGRAASPRRPPPADPQQRGEPLPARAR